MQNRETYFQLKESHKSYRNLIECFKINIFINGIQRLHQPIQPGIHL